MVGRAAAGAIDGVRSVPARAHLTTGSGKRPKTSSRIADAMITARDMRIRGTSHLMRPIRGFDLVIGAVLLLPAAYALWLVWPRL